MIYMFHLVTHVHLVPFATGKISAQLGLEPAISHINEHVDFTLFFFILIESLGNDSHYVLPGTFSSCV